MAGYICYTVDPVNRKKNKEDKEVTAKPKEVEEVEEADEQGDADDEHDVWRCQPPQVDAVTGRRETRVARQP